MEDQKAALARAESLVADIKQDLRELRTQLIDAEMQKRLSMAD